MFIFGAISLSSSMPTGNNASLEVSVLSGVANGAAAPLIAPL